MPLAFIFYTDRFVPEGSAGCARGPVVFIRPQFEGKDEGLFWHELCHVSQWWRMLGLGHSLLYTFSKRYRLRCEVEAYAVQARYYPDYRLPLFAKFISRDYGLDIETVVALGLLIEEERRSA